MFKLYFPFPNDIGSNFESVFSDPNYETRGARCPVTSPIQSGEVHEGQFHGGSETYFKRMSMSGVYYVDGLFLK